MRLTETINLWWAFDYIDIVANIRHQGCDLFFFCQKQENSKMENRLLKGVGG
jgi:hypothetical protein